VEDVELVVACPERVVLAGTDELVLDVEPA
jgi:hypothetical protein